MGEAEWSAEEGGFDDSSLTELRYLILLVLLSCNRIVAFLEAAEIVNRKSAQYLVSLLQTRVGLLQLYQVTDQVTSDLQ